MADLPQYQSQLTSVAPVAPVTGFQAASQSQSAIGLIADSVLDESSKQLARQAGAQAALSGNQPRFPGITGADKEYIASYKEEAFNSAYTNASKAIKQFALTAKSDPSSQKLEGYQASLEQYVRGVSATLPQDVQKKLMQSLSPLADSEYYSLALEQEQSNSMALKANTDNYLQQSSSDMAELALTGHYQAAAETRDRLKEAYPALSTEVDKMYDESVQIHSLKAALDKNDNKKVSAILEKNAGSPALLGYMAQYQASKRAHEGINYLQAQTAYESGVPLATVLGSYPLTEEDAQKLRLMDVRNQQSQRGAAEASYNISASADDAVALSQFSPKDMDSWYDEHIQAAGNDNIPTGALIQSSIKRPIPKFMKQLSAAINNGSPEQMTYAAGAIQLLSDKNPAALDGLSEADMMTAWTFKDLIDDAANTPEDAAKMARYESTGLNAEDRMQRQRTYADNLKAFDHDPKSVQSALANELGSRWLPFNKNVGKAPGFLPWNKGPEVPDRLIGIYNRLLTNAGQETKDPKKGHKLAIAQIKKTWSETNINGYAEISQNAPTFLLQNEGNYIQNDKKLAVKALADRNADARAKGDLTFMDIEYPNAPDFKGPIDIVEKSAKATTKIIVNGHPAELIVGSDVSSKNLSWPLLYKTADGFTQPLLDVDGSQARWYANVDTPREYQNAKNARSGQLFLQRQAPPPVPSRNPYENLAYGPQLSQKTNKAIGETVE